MSNPYRPLLDPIRLGDIDLPNRILMASMTRARTDNPDFIPNALQAKYYAQRASAGLILTEGTWPSREGVGFTHVPGLYTQQQADGWRRLRTDDYGGSAENRARFPLEIVDALIAAWTPGRVGVKLSPGLTGIGNFVAGSETLPTFEHLIGEISKRNLAYLQLMNPINDLTGTSVEVLGQGVAAHFRSRYSGRLVANGGYTFETGNALLKSGLADAVAFGAPFISNPDLVERFSNGLALSPSERDTYYSGGAEGYVDYPRANDELVRR